MRDHGQNITDRYIIFLSVILLLFSFTSQAQEICDNAIDDDFDGLVDLNDPDCDCNLLLPSSLIPNPSFEDKSCCPTQNAQLECADAWIQASNPTTDYVHTCGGYLGNSNKGAIPPLPFPDGEGGVGFRDGQAQVGPNYKEYVGACLTEPMEPGTTYRLDFFVGFMDNVYGSTSLNIAIFGSTRCTDLPFGGNSNTIGCPENTGRYKLIDEKPVSGSNEWIHVVFEFEATEPWDVIILGPGCDAHPLYTYDPYFYLDRLVLAESADFGIPFDRVEGRICEGGITISMRTNEGESYQWYKDGIALPGETEPVIFIGPDLDAEGIYTCVISNELGCLYSQSYQLRLPPYYETVSDTICEGDQYIFGQELLAESGSYERRIQATDGCDSIIQLELEVLPATYAELYDTICAGEQWDYHHFHTDSGGEFLLTLINTNGCDSLIDVMLEEIPPGTGIVLPDTIELNLGEKTDLSPLWLNPAYTALQWSGPNGDWLTDQSYVFDLLPLHSGYYRLDGEDPFGCPVSDSTLVLVRTNRYHLAIPNIFTPNGDHLNDRFHFALPASVQRVERMVIFDRWGNEMFDSREQDPGDFAWGWDGTFLGKLAAQGVYAYLMDVLYIDGQKKSYSGDVTLIR